MRLSRDRCSRQPLCTTHGESQRRQRPWRAWQLGWRLHRLCADRLYRARASVRTCSVAAARWNACCAAHRRRAAAHHKVRLDRVQLRLVGLANLVGGATDMHAVALGCRPRRARWPHAAAAPAPAALHHRAGASAAHRTIPDGKRMRGCAPMCCCMRVRRRRPERSRMRRGAHRRRQDRKQHRGGCGCREQVQERVDVVLHHEAGRKGQSVCGWRV